jgi:hypothetical protein
MNHHHPSLFVEEILISLMQNVHGYVLPLALVMNVEGTVQLGSLWSAKIWCHSVFPKLLHFDQWSHFVPCGTPQFEVKLNRSFNHLLLKSSHITAHHDTPTRHCDVPDGQGFHEALTA